MHRLRPPAPATRIHSYTRTRTRTRSQLALAVARGPLAIVVVAPGTSGSGCTRGGHDIRGVRFGSSDAVAASASYRVDATVVSSDAENRLWSQDGQKKQDHGDQQQQQEVPDQPTSHEASVPIPGARKRIAIVGGGITGLSAAFRLAHHHADKGVTVTVFECTERLGGWLMSERVPVPASTSGVSGADRTRSEVTREGRAADKGGSTGTVLFEYGPRTFRNGHPGALAALELLHDLGLGGLGSDPGLGMASSAPMAGEDGGGPNLPSPSPSSSSSLVFDSSLPGRYLYHPNRLLRLPGPGPVPGWPASPFGTALANITGVLGEPVLRRLIWALARAWWQDRGRKGWDGQEGGMQDKWRANNNNNQKNNSYNINDPTDESVAAFVTHRLGSEAADVFASAVYHGIYAGDIDRLSARVLLGPLWEREKAKERQWGRGGKEEAGDEDLSNPAKARPNNAARRQTWLSHDVAVHFDTLVRRRNPDLVRTLIRQARGHVAPDGGLGAPASGGSAGPGVFALRDGMKQLVDALEERLRSANNVEIRLGVRVEGVKPEREEDGGGVVIETVNNLPERFDHVLSTTSPGILAQQLAAASPSCPTSNQISSIQPLITALTHAATAAAAASITVVNLYYLPPSESSSSSSPAAPSAYDALAAAIPPDGFGYLVPRAVPLSENPECGLGVIFAGNGVMGRMQDNDGAEGKKPRGLKLAILLGGHWWDPDVFGPGSSTTSTSTKSSSPGNPHPDIPPAMASEAAAIDAATGMLQRHLRLPLATAFDSSFPPSPSSSTATDTILPPALARARIHHAAIPQYTVGHVGRLRALAAALAASPLGVTRGQGRGDGKGECIFVGKGKNDRGNSSSRLLVGGAWYTGIGLNDCVRAGTLMADAVVTVEDGDGDGRGGGGGGGDDDYEVKAEKTEGGEKEEEEIQGAGVGLDKFLGRNARGVYRRLDEE